VKRICAASAWLVRALDPYYAVLISLLAVAALPVPSGWAATIWCCSMIAVTRLLRHQSRERALELSRAILRTRIGDRRQVDRVLDENF
jgi:hypothetical protein